MYSTYTLCPSFRFRGSVSPGDSNVFFLTIAMVTGIAKKTSSVLGKFTQANSTPQSVLVLTVSVFQESETSINGLYLFIR